MPAPALTALYAPQARLVDLATGAVIGSTQASAQATASVAPDIVSAKITLNNTGVGQLEITLNNQRFGDVATPSPPWKYDDFSKNRRTSGQQIDGLGGIGFGQLIRVDFRYGEGTWIKMIIAQVNDLQYTFSARGAQVVVIGEDLLCRIKIKPQRDVPHERKQEEEIVQSVLDTVFTEASAKPSLALLGGAAQQEGRTQPLRSLTHEKTKTYFQFLAEIAERLDYELFLDFKDVRAAAGRASSTTASPGPITVASELELAFQPARSQYLPQGDKQSGLDPGSDAAAPMVVHYELRWGLNLVELTPKFKIFDMPTTAEAFGTNPGARARQTQTVTESELRALLAAELPASSNYSVAMVNAIDARKDYFSDAGPSAESNQSAAGTNLDGPRLKRKAGAEFLKKVRGFVTADGEVIGLPRLRPGQYVDIVGLRPPFDGYYYVTKTIHTLDATGYRTKFSLRRPGMQPPDQYLAVTPPRAITGTAPASAGGAP
jgi:hypothetical protein